MSTHVVLFTPPPAGWINAAGERVQAHACLPADNGDAISLCLFSPNKTAGSQQPSSNQAKYELAPIASL